MKAALSYNEQNPNNKCLVKVHLSQVVDISKHHMYILPTQLKYTAAF